MRDEQVEHLKGQHRPERSWGRSVLACVRQAAAGEGGLGLEHAAAAFDSAGSEFVDQAGLCLLYTSDAADE